MRKKTLLGIGMLVVAFASVCAVQAGPNTADFYLTTPDQYKGTMINLDVMGVRPVQFKSPIPELAFFHVATWDRQKNAPGGHLLMVAPVADATRIMKKYGDNMRHGDVDRMRGILTLSPGGHRPERPEAPPTATGSSTTTADQTPPPPHEGPRHHGPREQIWMIDYEGRSAAIIEAHKEAMQALPQEKPENDKK